MGLANPLLFEVARIVSEPSKGKRGEKEYVPSDIGSGTVNGFEDGGITSDLFDDSSES